MPPGYLRFGGRAEGRAERMSERVASAPAVMLGDATTDYGRLDEHE